MGSDHDHSQIVKGKRTKRQRPSSPFGLTAVTDSSSSGYSGDDESTEEEEDMANCLIMLAQGDRPNQIIQQENNIADKVQKFTSNNNNKAAGMYVYECKTCNRSFASFQALGGHRASHKKPKATLQESSEKKSSSTSCTVAAVVTIKDDFNSESPLKGNKIHECSICGSEFTSGQALGGHMRRHRAATANASNINNSQLTTTESSIGDVKPATTARSILQLDLNLPAPEDDHHIRFGTTQQSSSLVFSAPALVDCHY